ncbi:hypothetical protein FOL47_010200 [Perkinsus chesapeaki]|uniref:Uncharacterized protein n=1 Tax=Perkinsus chesapeaki TaxID=330153 RepID=A0A7J6MQ41_PERCH|nr:hypothetical protein FOL47_010200 [Perkinsus chesapeaki]
MTMTLIHIFCLVYTVTGGIFDSVVLDPLPAVEATTTPPGLFGNIVLDPTWETDTTEELFAGIVLDPIQKVDESTSMEGPKVTATTTLAPSMAQGGPGSPVDWAALDSKMTALLVIASLLLVVCVASMCLIIRGIARWRTVQDSDQSSNPKVDITTDTPQAEYATEHSLDAIV